MRPRKPTTGSAAMSDHYLHHSDGRRVRVFTQAWRDGWDPRLEGLVRVVIQPVQGYPLMVDACHPLFDGWTFPEAVGDRVAMVLGPGWAGERAA